MSLENFFILKRPLRIRARKSRFGQPCSLPEELCRQFSLAELQLADSEWKCGRYYYKGVPDGPGTSLISIKYFDDKKKFQDEIQLLCQLRHQNLIRPLGYCKEEKGKHYLALYEHTNGSLADHLHPDNSDPLPWKRRLEISIGAVSGLHYLHTGAKRAIFHLHVNSSCILLDRDWAAKISNFGSFSISPSKPKPKTMKKSRNLDWAEYTAFRIPPECYSCDEVTEKFDVFLLGVVLLEVLAGRPAYNYCTDLISEISHSLQVGNINDFMDPYLRGKIAPMCCKEFVEIALSCVVRNPSERPSMGEVKVTLQLALELQEKADSVPSFSGYTYEQVHFQVPDCNELFGYGESLECYSDGGESSECYSYASLSSDDDMIYEGR